MLVPSEELPKDAPTILGYDFSQGRDLDGLMGSMLRTGLQATSLGQAVNEINRMVSLSGPSAVSPPPAHASPIASAYTTAMGGPRTADPPAAACTPPAMSAYRHLHHRHRLCRSTGG